MSLPNPNSRTAALVTGASAGIGAAIARELAGRGHTTILVARRRANLEELAEELSGGQQVRAEVLECDLGDPEARDRLPEQIGQLGLDVEILVNNAGFATNGPFHESDAERELQQIRVLVEAPVGLMRAFLPAMIDRGRGAILNVSSTAGMQPLPYSAGYSAAKAYLLSFSEALHQETRGHGITVSALCPGPVSTDFWEISGWQTSGGSFEETVPRPAWITPEQAAQAGVEGLEAGHRVIVPGTRMWAAMHASRYLPHALKLPALERMMRPR